MLSVGFTSVFLLRASGTGPDPTSYCTGKDPAGFGSSLSDALEYVVQH
jgi:hypothetical protein